MNDPTWNIRQDLKDMKDELRADIKDCRKEIVKTKVEIATLKGKASAWGFIAGTVAGVIAALIGLMK